MKNLYVLLLALVGNIFSMSAQVIDVATNLNRPQLMEIKDNFLYVAQSQSGVISKIDISDSTYIATDIITGLNNPVGLKIYGDELYVTESYGNRIFKVDLTDPTLSQTDILTNIDRPSGIEIIGNELFFTIASNSNDKLMKVDLTDTNKTVIQLLGGLQDPVDIAAKGNELYISEFLGNKISKINTLSPSPTKVDVVTGGLNGPVALHFIGADLFVANFNSNKVSKVTVGQSLPISSTANVETVTNPYGLVFDGNEMYVSDFDTKIVTFNIYPVSTEPQIKRIDWSVFPNPAQNFLQIHNLEHPQYFSIISISGQVVQSGIARPNEYIEIKNIAKGNYLIRLENGTTKKFIKQ